jgi:hypothetical protein
MLVRFKVNLGSRDAAQFNLDWSTCLGGHELEVEKSAGEWLVSNGIADAVVRTTARQPELKAVPPEAETVEAKPKRKRKSDG